MLQLVKVKSVKASKREGMCERELYDEHSVPTPPTTFSSNAHPSLLRAAVSSAFAPSMPTSLARSKVLSPLRLPTHHQLSPTPLPRPDPP